LADARNVVVGTADEADQGFPRILLQDADAREGGGAAGEVGIGEGPGVVEGGEVRGQVEVVVEEGFGVV